MRRFVPSTLALTLFAAVATAALPSGVEAQQPPATELQHVVAVNPIGIVFGVFGGNYERQFSDDSTVGLGATLWSHGDSWGDASARGTYLSVAATSLLYPAGSVLEGFAIGGVGGFTTYSASARFGSESDSERFAALGLGVELSYNFLMGDNNRYYFGIGTGAKRLVPFGESFGATLAYPTGRLSVGMRL
jgi:hypothetical protein